MHEFLMMISLFTIIFGPAALIGFTAYMNWYGWDAEQRADRCLREAERELKDMILEYKKSGQGFDGIGVQAKYVDECRANWRVEHDKKYGTWDQRRARELALKQAGIVHDR